MVGLPTVIPVNIALALALSCLLKRVIFARKSQSHANVLKLVTCMTTVYLALMAEEPCAPLLITVSILEHLTMEIGELHVRPNLVQSHVVAKNLET